MHDLILLKNPQKKNQIHRRIQSGLTTNVQTLYCQSIIISLPTRPGNSQDNAKMIVKIKHIFYTVYFCYMFIL